VTWSNLSDTGPYTGSGTGTLTITGASIPLDGDLYRAVFSNAAPSSVASAAATLTVNSVPNVTTQPGDLAVNVRSAATLTAPASGHPTPTVQWYVSIDGGTTFNPLSNGGIYSGVTSGTLIISSTTAAMNAYEYQAVFTNLVGATPTVAATLTVNTVPVMG